jgi:hypothetical protein
VSGYAPTRRLVIWDDTPAAKHKPTFEALARSQGRELMLTRFVHLTMLVEQGLAEPIANGFFLGAEDAVRMVTGTPVDNSLTDFWYVVDIAKPSLLDC